MEKLISKILRIAKEQSALDGQDKALVRARLEDYIKNSVIEGELTSHTLRKSMFYSLLNLKTKPMIPALLAVTLLFGGGISYAAEGALPGDALYVLKVNVNEEVRSRLAFTTEDKAGVEARLAEKRLEEAAKLAAEGKLNAGVEGRLAERFSQHVEKVEERIVKLEQEGKLNAAADLRTKFETSIEVHGQILAALSPKDQERQPSDDNIIAMNTQIQAGTSTEIESTEEQKSKDLLGLVRIKANEAAQKRAELEVKMLGKENPKAPEAAKGRIQAATNKILEVRKFIEKNKDKFEAEVIVKVEERLNVADSLVTEAKVVLEEENYTKAFRLASEAHHIAQEAKLLLKVGIELPITICFNGKIQIDSKSDSVVAEGSVASRPMGRLGCIDGDSPKPRPMPVPLPNETIVDDKEGAGGLQGDNGSTSGSFKGEIEADGEVKILPYPLPAIELFPGN